MATKVSQTHKQQFANGTRNNKGILNPNWKPASERKTLLSVAIRQTKKYSEWRAAIFQRDNFKCVQCGSGSKAINADHIKKFADILQENNVKSMEDGLACDPLWDTANGRTLCVDCHKQTDTYGSNNLKKKNRST